MRIFIILTRYEVVNYTVVKKKMFFSMVLINHINMCPFYIRVILKVILKIIFQKRYINLL